MRSALAAGLIAIGLFLSACGRSHVSERPDLDPDKRLVDLTEEELRVWCEWLGEIYDARYPDSTDGEPLCSDGSGYNATIEECVDNFTRGLDETCSQTVGRQAECTDIRVDGECPARFPVPEDGPCRLPDDCGVPYHM